MGDPYEMMVGIATFHGEGLCFHDVMRVRPELDLRAQGKRVLRTLGVRPKGGPEA